MQDLAKTIGESFKLRRKEMNLSLKEVESATSIRSNYLQCIEDGQFNNLISPVHAQGFVKQYASFLGIDGEKIVRENPKLFFASQVAVQPLYRQEFDYGIGTMEMRNLSGGGVRWLPNVVWIIAALAILGGAWLLATYLDLL